MKNYIKILFILLISFLFGQSKTSANNLNVGKNETYKNFNSALKNSENGDTIFINGGIYSGNFIINKSVSIIGKNNPVFDGNNNGTVITVKAPNVFLTGLKIINSGKLLDKEDAGILVLGNNVKISYNILKSVLFGVYFRQADNGIVTNNVVEGKKELDIPRRGDLFRAWYSKNLLVKDNEFKYGRDVIIWFSENSIIENNNMSGARYGLHFMYSGKCKIIHNTMNKNSVGIYLMYSKNLEVRNNLIVNNRGASGFGIGLKDLDNVNLKENVIADNRVGIFVDNCPRNYDAQMNYGKNLIAYNETGVQVTSSLENSKFINNSFLENYEQTSLSSGQDARNDYWKENYWSDYSGYDKNKDGIGDIPYKPGQILEGLTDDNPNLKFFLYSPAINTINYAAQAFPIFMPEPKLVDDNPATKPIMPENVPSLKAKSSSGLLLFSIFLTLISAAVLFFFVYRNKLVHRTF